ncbi:MAG: redox-sensing transcriptional repressor Rex [Firmicutes bacterium]|nr:redox-sensing transcriptional repressor Rex [Bacillota bacterium]
MPRRLAAPKQVIKRLPVYLRILDDLVRRGIKVVSSRELSAASGFTAEQIRKDLAHFGAFGTRGTGYNTTFLRDKIIQIIGLDRPTNIIVVGAGHLGKALTRYNAINNPYVNIVGVFDTDPGTVGSRIGSLKILHLLKIPEFVKRYCVRVAIITVPAEAAQQVVNQVTGCGVKAILNFAPAQLQVPEDVHIHNADLTTELQSLIYYATPGK